MALSKECRSLLQSDRVRGFPRALDEQEIPVIASFDCVLFPAIEVNTGGLEALWKTPRYDQPLCHIDLSNAGIFVFGFAMMDVAGIKSARLVGTVKVMGIGVAGALSSQEDFDRASARQNAALTEYARVRATLENTTLRSRFDRAPVCAYCLEMHDIENVVFPKKIEDPIRIKTTLGTLEFLAPLTEAESARLREWWDKKEAGPSAERSASSWTLAKALLYFRKNQTMAKGLAAYFSRTIRDADAFAITHELLRGTLPADTFWSFLKELQSCGEEDTDTICTSVIGKERRQAPGRLGAGVILLVAGSAISYYGNAVSLLIGGICLAVWGLVLSIRAAASLTRSYTFATSLRHVSSSKG